jgi:hypothetical protein
MSREVLTRENSAISGLKKQDKITLMLEVE